MPSLTVLPTLLDLRPETPGFLVLKRAPRARLLDALVSHGGLNTQPVQARAVCMFVGLGGIVALVSGASSHPPPGLDTFPVMISHVIVETEYYPGVPETRGALLSLLVCFFNLGNCS